MKSEITEKKALYLLGAFLVAAFIVLTSAEFTIENGNHPDRWHISFPESEGAALDFELCQGGSSARNFSYAVIVDREKTPRSESTLHVDAHGCATAHIPVPEPLPDRRFLVSVLVTDDAGQEQSVFRAFNR